MLCRETQNENCRFLIKKISRIFFSQKRKWNLGNNIHLIARTEHDAVAASGSNEKDLSYMNIKALNEWDSKYSGNIDWRQKLDVQRGAVLANELKHNSCKLSKWTVQALLAGSDLLKYGYITRFNMKDSSRHVILGTQQVNNQNNFKEKKYNT